MNGSFRGKMLASRYFLIKTTVKFSYVRASVQNMPINFWLWGRSWTLAKHNFVY